MVRLQALFGEALGDPKYDWSFVTTPQPNVNSRIMPLNGLLCLLFTAKLYPE